MAISHDLSRAASLFKLSEAQELIFLFLEINFVLSAKIEPAYDASKVRLSGPGLESGKVGEPCKFKADCSEAGEAPLTVDVVNEDGTKVPRVRVKDNGDGTHEYVIPVIFFQIKVALCQNVLNLFKESIY